MKKIYTILFTLAAFITSVKVSACNICGCGVGGYHYGILPQFQKNFIGIRYWYRSYDSHLEADHDVDKSYETFQSFELWGRFYPAKRIQVFIFVPYNMNDRKEGNETLRLRGLGDMVISANYNLLNTYDSLTPAIKQNLLIGGGLKLPTGKFREIRDGQTVNQNFQLGTGSLDYLFNLIYTARYKKYGINTEFTYNFNTTNKDEYRFGNTLKTGLTAFYVAGVSAFTFMPNVGVSYEQNRNNSQFDIPFEETGGWASLYHAGVEMYYKNIALGFTYTHPGRQELFSGNVQSNDRFSVRATIMF